LYLALERLKIHAGLPVARYAFIHSFTILDYTALSAGEAYYLCRRSAWLTHQHARQSLSPNVSASGRDYREQEHFGSHNCEDDAP